MFVFLYETVMFLNKSEKQKLSVDTNDMQISWSDISFAFGSFFSGWWICWVWLGISLDSYLLWVNSFRDEKRHQRFRSLLGQFQVIVVAICIIGIAYNFEFYLFILREFFCKRLDEIFTPETKFRLIEFKRWHWDRNRNPHRKRNESEIFRKFSIMGSWRNIQGEFSRNKSGNSTNNWEGMAGFHLRKK